MGDRFDEDSFCTEFQQIFNIPPRSIQIDVSKWMHESSGTFQVAQVATGGGKTCIGVYEILQALKNGFGRGVYVCATKSLQFQIATDARRWNVGPVVCLYGKNNYWCKDRINSCLLVNGDLKTRQVLDEIQKQEKGLLPPRDIFDNVCKRCNYRKTEELWESITAEKCDCYDKMWKNLTAQKADNIKDTMLKNLQCEHGLQRLRAEKSKLFIINMSLFLTYAKHNVILKESDYLCIDEAHELSNWAMNAFEDILPHPFDVQEMNDFLTRCGSSNLLSVQSLISSKFPHIDSILFSNEVANYFKNIELKLGSDDVKAVCKLMKESMEILKNVEKTVYDHPALSIEDIVNKVDNNLNISEEGSENMKKICTLIREVAECEKDVNIWLNTVNSALDENIRSSCNEIRHGTLVYDIGKKLSKEDKMCKEFLDSLKELKKMCKIVEVSQMAGDIGWATGDHKDIVPLAHNKGIKYIPSTEFVANKLKEFVWNNVEGVLLMSATMASCENTSTPFQIFCNEIGLDETTTTMHAFPEVFDKSKVKISAPCIGKYDARNQDKRKEFLRMQVNTIEEHLRMLPDDKSALIMSPSLAEIKDLYNSLSMKLNDIAHIMFSDKTSFKRFSNTSMKAIVYGSDGLSTGVNLPGRVGLVVITRPWNPIPDQAKQQYEKTYLGVTNDKYWKYYRYRRDRKAFQGAGRLQRCQSDTGTILFLGESYENCKDSSSERLRLNWNQHEQIERPNKIRKV